MAMTLEEISDRFEINDLLVRYCTALDSRNFDEFEEIFTRDAIIDYTAMGGVRGSVAEIVEWLKKTMVRFPAYQHLIANSAVAIDGDRARARTMCHNPMVIDRGGGRSDVFVCGLWYVDELVRTSAGWRILKRTEDRGYVQNPPAALRAEG